MHTTIHVHPQFDTRVEATELKSGALALEISGSVDDTTANLVIHLPAKPGEAAIVADNLIAKLLELRQQALAEAARGPGFSILRGIRFTRLHGEPNEDALEANRPRATEVDER
jgi:hypothetical protein